MDTVDPTKPAPSRPPAARRGDEAAARGSPGTRRRRTRLSTWIARAAAWLPVLALAGAATPRVFNLQFWPAELLWHFTETFFFLSVVLTVILLALSFYLAAGAAALLALFFGLAVSNVPGEAAAHPRSMLPAAQAYPGEAAEIETTTFRLITHNLYVRNNRRAALADWLGRQDADVIVMQEIDSDTAPVLEAAAGLYPHQFFAWPRNWVERPELRDELSGLAILSRFPLDEKAVFRQTRWSAPVASARLTLPGGTQVRVVVVHTSNPVRRSGLRARNALLQALAEEVKRYDGPLVVAGDFNATPYTPAFAQFLSTAGLTTTRAYPGTYPQIAGAFGLPIDHVLVRSARIAGIEALDAFGSDHRPLRADLIVARPPSGGASP